MVVAAEERDQSGSRDEYLAVGFDLDEPHAEQNTPLGLAVFIDDKIHLLEETRTYFRDQHFLTATIDTSLRNAQLNFESYIDQIFEECHRMGIENHNVVFIVDNRMREFSIAISQLSDDTNTSMAYFAKKEEQGSSINSVFGRDGHNMGLFIVRWLFNDVFYRHGPFNVCLTSHYPIRNVKLKLREVAESYPKSFVGHISKPDSDDETDAFRFYKTVTFHTRSRKKDKITEIENYPYPEIAQHIISALDLSDDELSTFLELEPSFKTAVVEALRKGEAPPLGTNLWRAKVWATMDCLLQCERTIATSDLAREWFNSHNPGIGAAPREVVISGTMDDVMDLRDLLEFDL
jgi:hypothetical protein